MTDLKTMTDKFRDSQQHSMSKLSAENRILIDTQLQKMALLSCNMGIDSTPEERDEYKVRIGICLLAIKNIDNAFFEEIQPYANSVE